MKKDDNTSEAGSSPRASPDAESEAQATKKRKTLEEIEIDASLPEPPSKKAKRALKKGKPVPTKSANADSDDDLAGEDAAEKKKARSEHGVWIGNLPFNSTPIELRRWLVANSGGAITDETITRMKMPMTKDKSRPKPVSKGFAYVDFDGAVPQMAAIGLTETNMGSRNVLIKSSTSFEGRPKVEKAKDGDDADGDEAAAAAKKKDDRNAPHKVFVGNLGFETTEDDLWHHFEKCGGIDWVKVATFEDTGKCKGYAWVRFKSPEAAGWAAKGFVKIKEEIATEADFKEDGAGEGSEDGAEEERKYKSRKWWVNKLKGRTLKLEIAEDDKTRYKKRFKKDPTGGKGRNGEGGGEGGGGGGEFVEDAVKSAMAADGAAA